jgi:hypothetical protein
VTDGRGGYRPGELVTDKTIELNKEQRERLFNEIEKCRFWAMNSPKRKNIRDGAEWVVEGVKDKNYHVVHGNSPAPGDCIRTIGLLMMELAKHTEAEIY